MSLFKGLKKNKKIYGNCKVLSPNGIPMFKCDEKKANWYLKRELAEIIEEKPLVIKLNFEPKGLGNHGKNWGLSNMFNRCVVCGNKNFLTKHHVVPHCYRKYFPLKVKSHDFHDVLCVCKDCHESYEKKADILKNKISNDFKAPLNGKLENRKDILKYSKLASTLLRKNDNIPKERIKEIKGQIKSHFGIKRLTKKRLRSMISTKNVVIKKTHGKIVVEKLKDLQSFVELWRNHFVKEMKPSYLPDKWSLNKNIYE